ncbi:hypothetical protein [Phyllobacterium myrsinacearum]|uniref:Uncharacterized protein n=1 Tax=Phyllobacterium myrsinacearum TaxID=28101 RepID=A0A839ENJ5_9HYPH|nr:hypothetical protein [Phyllobacterium myrsinacearum]MBA8881661.1 hypothetical protein [Phyllobacterium myrsinacearum]
MSLTVLKPVVIKPAPVQTPQCCIEVPAPGHNQTWRNRYRNKRPHLDPDLCQHASTVKIDGKHYCTPHAGQLALKKWLAGELIEKEKKQ